MNRREPEREPYMTHLLDAAAADLIGIPIAVCGLAIVALETDHVTTKTDAVTCPHCRKGELARRGPGQGVTTWGKVAMTESTSPTRS